VTSRTVVACGVTGTSTLLGMAMLVGSGTAGASALVAGAVLGAAATVVIVAGIVVTGMVRLAVAPAFVVPTVV
jgi:hypothetical protein